VIPRIIHQIWLGPNPLPEQDAAFVETWKRQHPSWEHRLWTEDNLPDDVRPEIRDRLRIPAERSDLLRLEVVARHGGVYIDTDFECLQPLDPWLEGVDLFAAYLREHAEEGPDRPARINNAIFGAIPRHPVVVRALAEAAPVQRYGYDKNAAGPMFLDRMLQGSDATLFPRRLFYPKATERAGAIGFHHQARTWKDVEGLRRAVRVARRRREAARLELRELEARRRLLEAPGSLRLRAEWRAFEARRAARQARRKVRRKVDRLHEVAYESLDPQRKHLRALVSGRMPRAASAVAVPKVIHHIWLDGPVPGKLAARRRTWRAANPGWDLRLWVEDDIPEDPVRPELLNRLRSPAERVDLLRLEILLRHGGVVVDAGLGGRPLAPLVGTATCVVSGTAQAGLTTSLVGSSPDHPAIAAAIAEQRPREWSGYDPDATGVGALERARAAGATVAVCPGFERGEVHDERALRAVIREEVVAIEADLAQLEERLVALRAELATKSA
jgi:mannosyltransferase OCH1-like enzyme